MEKTALGMLEEMAATSQWPELKRAFLDHVEETRGHITNIERSFELLGVEVDEQPCPAIEGPEQEGKAAIKMTDDSIVDAVLLAGATETEHHEIGVYETLVTNARACSADEVAQLEQEGNLDSEQAALDKVRSLGQKISTEGTAVAA